MRKRLRLRRGCGGVARGVGAEQVDVSCEGLTRLTVYEKANLLDLRQIGVQGAEDGEDRQVFHLNAGRMRIDEAGTEVDDRKLAAGCGGLW